MTPCCGFPATLQIDENDIEISMFGRASGPGGQNVNKLSTAAQLRFDTRGIALAPMPEARLDRLAGQRMTKDGVIVIHAQRFRTQERNRADAIDRLLRIAARGDDAADPATRRRSRRWVRKSAGWKAKSAAATSRRSAALAVSTNKVSSAHGRGRKQLSFCSTRKQPATTTVCSRRTKLGSRQR